MSSEATEGASPSPPAGRLAFLDGVRAIACLLVLGYHFWNALKDVPSPSLFVQILSPLHYGDLGVIVFFVLSGLVISLTIPVFKYLSQLLSYILKRMIRLDPTYWAIIWTTIAIRLAISHFGLGETYALPPIPHIFLNMFYLDNIFEELLGVESIVAVGWTLAYELQFYLFFSIVIYAAHRWTQQESNTFWNILGVFLVISALGSTALAMDYPKTLNPYMLGAWRFFALGGLLGLSLRGQIQIKTQWLVLLALSQLVAFRPDSVAGMLTILVLLGLRGSERLQRVFGTPALVFIGKISYSLYLTHALVGNRIIRFAVRKFIDPSNSLSCLIVFIVATAVSIFSAWILYHLVERPTIKVARKMNRFIAASKDSVQAN